MALNRYTQFPLKYFKDGDSIERQADHRSEGVVDTVSKREDGTKPVQASIDRSNQLPTSWTGGNDHENNGSNLAVSNTARPSTPPGADSVNNTHSGIEAAPTSSAPHSTSDSAGNKISNDASESAQPCLQRQRGTVWAAYSSRCELDLHKPVDIAVSRTEPSKMVMVRRPAVDMNTKKREMVALLMQQPNFAACWEVFDAVPTPFWVCEYSIVTLEHVCALPTFPTVMEVTAIAGQVRQDRYPFDASLTRHSFSMPSSFWTVIDWHTPS